MALIHIIQNIIYETIIDKKEEKKEKDLSIENDITDQDFFMQNQTNPNEIEISDFYTFYIDDMKNKKNILKDINFEKE